MQQIRNDLRHRRLAQLAIALVVLINLDAPFDHIPSHPVKLAHKVLVMRDNDQLDGTTLLLKNVDYFENAVAKALDRSPVERRGRFVQGEDAARVLRAAKGLAQR